MEAGSALCQIALLEDSSEVEVKQRFGHAKSCSCLFFSEGWLRPRFRVKKFPVVIEHDGVA